MPSLAELRKKIKGISSTRQITKAMKMVAGARFGRAGRQRNDARYYEAELEKVLFAFLSLAGTPRQRIGRFYVLPGTKQDAAPDGKVGLFVIAGDKGLCGDFNNAVMREADNVLKKHGERVTALFVVGRKAVDHYRNGQIEQKREYMQFFNRFDFGMADKIGQELFKVYQEQELSELIVVNSHFKSMIKQQVTTLRLLPIEALPPAGNAHRGMIYEPEEEVEVLSTLVPMYLKAKMYALLRDSFAAELAARMRAMDNATRNAGGLIDSITLEMNKVRQAVITRELAEIIATNEVVK
ncbi:MAG: ATP synthase F1 subunit gamma [Chitinispirillaceae bacterium]|nr:ATP synthase F1 subunit gamma [Chitinispirillaceae bacterium]